MSAHHSYGFWRHACRTLAMCTLLPVAVLACSRQTPTLNLLVWEGYADPSFVAGFEEDCQCKVSASYMGSSDELIAKLRGGSAGNFDVISPSSDVATTIAESGLAEPIDVSTMPAYGELSQALRDAPLVRTGGKVYGVPFTWGPDPLLYDMGAFPEPPASWNVLWDPKYRGKISVWDDLSTVYMAAQVLGYDKPDPSHIYNLTDEELDKVKAKLLELKPNVRKLWTTGGELTNLFQNHEIVAAMGWPLMTTQLKKANFPIGETIPQENTTGWIDHLMVTAASANKDLAKRFLAYMITAQTQQKVVAVTGYIPANPKVAESLSADERRELHLDDIDAYQKRLNFWQNVPRRAKYNQIWNEVKAAQ